MVLAQTQLGADIDGEAAEDSAGSVSLGKSITYRIAMGPQQGPRVFTLQTLPDCSDGPLTPRTGNVAGFSLPQGTLS